MVTKINNKNWVRIFLAGAFSFLLPSSLFLQLRQFAVLPAGARCTALLFVNDRLVATAYREDGSYSAQRY